VIDLLALYGLVHEVGQPRGKRATGRDTAAVRAKPAANASMVNTPRGQKM
jgi:hypothetical protein